MCGRLDKLHGQAAILRAEEAARERLRERDRIDPGDNLDTADGEWELAEAGLMLAPGTLVDRSRARRFVAIGSRALVDADKRRGDVRAGGAAAVASTRRRTEVHGVVTRGLRMRPPPPPSGPAGLPARGVEVGSGASDLRQRLERAGALHPPTRQDLAPESEGAMTLPVRFDVAGRRYRDFSDALARLVEKPFDDWPLEGPRSLLEYLQMLWKKSQTPGSYHTRWVAESGIAKKGVKAHVHDVGMDILEAALTYGQLQAGNCAS